MQKLPANTLCSVQVYPANNSVRYIKNTIIDNPSCFLFPYLNENFKEGNFL